MLEALVNALMSHSFNLTFIVVTNDQEILNTNLLASPCLQGNHLHQIIVQQGYDSAAVAYNDAFLRAQHDIIVFVHQDVYLPAEWIADLESSIRALTQSDPNWGVLGCWGVKQNGDGFGYLYTPGQNVIGSVFSTPEPVQTLDEVVLAVRKDSGLRFNEKLRGFHLYGADICLEASRRGMRSYAISAFCVHNSRQHFRLPREFYSCYWQLKSLHKEFLPIHTSCIRITRLNWPMWWRRMKEIYHQIKSAGHQDQRGPRAGSPEVIISKLRADGLVRL